MTPLRFVAGVIGLWTVARLVILLPETPPPALDSPAIAGAYVAPRSFIDAPMAAFLAVPLRARAGEMFSLDRASDALADRGAKPVLASASSGSTYGITPDEPRIDAGVDLSPSGLITPAAAPARTVSRWSGNLYLFRRGDGGANAIASGGQLGGSQGGARVAYRLDAAGSLAAAGRLSSPLDDTRAAEAAIGLDWHLFQTVPLRVSIERRVDLGGAGRNAWSAYAAGGFWQQRGKLVVDGYAQAGIVGARRRDLFADGAIRAGMRQDLGSSRSLTIGGGAWGGAQPRVERLDIGPRVALDLPIGGTAATLAAEWRVRVAGDAAPGSGLAITFAADF